ncbi:hypothetical protein GO001_25210 [Streptomyces sp. NRRL B-1677]|uniref:Uncharacterized protein n=1 Tax=Streptomyces klenkii TaxID=1420899 RepID=A0A3B0BW93_9ACTN|nr:MULTISPECIES: hypothetical protein [Streptomyces]MBF6048468.1 hypothetical protein [Streptomyces sp. NRRL B-1677]RKN77643.1 hypothetical protein D7231_02775 [Streptomyces klenkii]
MVLPGGLSSRAVPSCHAREVLGLGASGAGFGANADGRIEIIARISAGPLNGRYQLVPSGNWSP